MSADEFPASTSAWRRALAARRTIALVWLAQLAVAWVAGSALASVTGAAIHPFAIVTDERFLFDLTEAFVDQPAIPTLLAFVLLVTVALGGLAWALAFPAIACSLARPISFAELAQECVRRAPAMLVLAIYALLARALLVAPIVALAVAAELGIWALPLLLAASALATLFADRARVDSILHAQSAYSPRAFARACRRTLRRPTSLAAGLLLFASGWIVSIGVLALGISNLWGDGTVWAVRSAVALSTFLACWRVGTVVRAAVESKGVDAAGDNNSTAAG